MSFGPERKPAEHGDAGGVAAARRPVLLTSLATLLVLLAGLNLFQYFTRGPSAAVQPARRPPLTDQQVIDRFHELFYASPRTWPASKWLGVITLQNPNDVWIHQEIITEVKPDFIIEAGTAAGGSAALWAMLLEQVNPTGKVITIDILDQIEFIKEIAKAGWVPGSNDPGYVAESARRLAEIHRLPIWKQRVEFIKGSSTDPAIVGALSRRAKGRRVLVILDSLHARKHVLDELNAYAPLVNVGSYIIVQDTNVNGHPVLKEHGPGPMEAVEEFLATNPDFEPDRSRERLLFTMHPKGYLKRVR